MPRQLLVDSAEFAVDRKALSEALKSKPGTGVFPLPLRGRLSACGIVNGNNREYPKTVWEKNVNDKKSPLNQLIEKSSAFGLLEHPADGRISLLSPISHILTKVWLEGTEVFGEVMLLDTAEGQKLTKLIEAGYNPLVSSRGFGTLVRNERGVDVVQEDYVCEGWDVVFKPSFSNAELVVPREVLAAVATAPTESLSAAPAKPVVASPTTTRSGGNNRTQPSMEKITAIRESVDSLRAVDPSKLEPARYAEGLARIAQLHREISAMVAEDAKMSWDATRFHDQLNDLEKTWTEAVRAPAREVVSLKEDRSKVLKVLKAVTETGLKLRSTLSETVKSASKVKSDFDEAINRGKGWMTRCQVAEGKLKKLNEKYNVACEALDEFTRRYHADTTELARRLVTLEFKVTDVEVLKKLNEAKTAKAIQAIREDLEKATKPEGKATEPVAAGAEAEKPKTAESAPEVKPEVVPEAVKPEEKKPVVETLRVAATRGGQEAEIVYASTTRPFSISESIGLTTRLSAVAK